MRVVVRRSEYLPNILYLHARSAAQVLAYYDHNTEPRDFVAVNFMRKMLGDEQRGARMAMLWQNKTGTFDFEVVDRSPRSDGRKMDPATSE